MAKPLETFIGFKNKNESNESNESNEPNKVNLIDYTKFIKNLLNYELKLVLNIPNFIFVKCYEDKFGRHEYIIAEPSPKTNLITQNGFKNCVRRITSSLKIVIVSKK